MAEARNIADKIVSCAHQSFCRSGGKGMRIVEERNQFEEQMKRAQSEALSAFGDGSVLLKNMLPRRSY